MRLFTGFSQSVEECGLGWVCGGGRFGGLGGLRTGLGFCAVNQGVWEVSPKLFTIGWQVFVGAIAEGRGGGVFALAPGEGGTFGDLDFDGLEAGSFVRAIAEGGVGRASAGAPEVGAGFDFEGEGAAGADDWFFGHARMNRMVLGISRGETGRMPESKGAWSGQRDSLVVVTGAGAGSVRLATAFALEGADNFAETGTDPVVWGE